MSNFLGKETNPKKLRNNKHDLEVSAKDDGNFRPVREYVAWFANRS